MSAKFTIKEIFSDHWDSVLLDSPNVRPIVDITPDKVSLLKQSGASGCCLMSSLMTSEDVTQLISQFK